jgi:hypothetical protein
VWTQNTISGLETTDLDTLVELGCMLDSHLHLGVLHLHVLFCEGKPKLTSIHHAHSHDQRESE